MKKADPTIPSHRARIAVLVLAIVALAIGLLDVAFDGVHDGAPILQATFHVAPPAVTAKVAASRPAMLTAVGPGRDDRWSPDESAGGTRPDAMH